MPMSTAFRKRLYPIIDDIADHYGTPFHIYDETGIRDTGEKVVAAFSKLKEFREYFAVKALPNPHILKIIKSIGFGFDCSSIAELILSRQIGARGEEIIFSSNNTDITSFLAAETDGGSILNLDDISLIEKVPRIPELISFRYNPGPKRSGNDIIGNPVESKYGLTTDQMVWAYKRVRDLGVTRFGMHTMLASNELNYQYIVQTSKMLLDLSEKISRRLDITFDFINIGGGLGIPYKPDETPFNFEKMANEITVNFNNFEKRNKYQPKLFLESGRYITGPHGVLVVTAINQKDIYRKYVGVDACMSSLMRPGIYGAYHHITVPAKEDLPETQKVDVVGSLCENNDKFAIQRLLPKINTGDILCIHDTGAHGHSMGFNYNGQLRPKELLLRQDGTVELIRREETIEDYLATLSFEPNISVPQACTIPS